ncbi:MAG: hypothetical protein IJU19_07630 [Bacteroidales bacterium]|nr:hypothetical protein [Bacteroidales bacterium]
MKQYFTQDKSSVGIAVGLGIEAVYALLLTAVLLIVGESPAEHVRWYGGGFILLILVLRYYAKGQAHLKVVKSIIVVLFVSFVVFIFALYKLRLLQ